MTKKSSGKSWYGVRCVFVAEGGPEESRDLPPDEKFYEERVTLWAAKSFEKAIALAEAEAREYAEVVGCAYTGLAQAFSFGGEPTHGTEVYSLLRRSSLEPSDYLDRFFDTGSEVGGSLSD